MPDFTPPSSSTPPSVPSSPDGLYAYSHAVGDHASAAIATTTASSSRAPRPDGEDIEMEPIPGHRRRKSSILMNPVGQPGAAPGRARSQSFRSAHAHVGLGDEAKIPEERGHAAEPTATKDERSRDSFSDEDLHDDEETGLNDRDRRRKRKRRRRNTQLDQRVARDRHITVDERKEADKSVIRRLLIDGSLILLWYFFSLSISLYNKWMFDENRLNFAFPLFTTSTHMLVQFCLSLLVLYFVPRLRPQNAHNSDMGRSRHETEPNNGPVMSKWFYLTRITPCGMSTGLDIGLGNTSLKFVSLTFYTMCKSSNLAFVLLFAFAFRLETPTWRLVAIIGGMTLGVILMVFGEVEFKLGGFFLVIGAAFFSGLRWALTQILLLRNPATSNPFASIFYLTPVMFVTLFLLAIPVEGFGPLFEGLKLLSVEWGVVLTPLFLLFPGCIAFLMTASEFALLQRTSVVTLSIAGIFKEVITISAASVVFHDKLTVINFVGLIATMLAIFAYNYVKITKMRQEAQVDVHGRHADLDSTSPSSNSASDADEDATAETAGLLHRGVHMDGPLVTSDGDIQPNLLSSGSRNADDPKEYKSERED